jgi:hypothetical protein
MCVPCAEELVRVLNTGACLMYKLGPLVGALCWRDTIGHLRNYCADWLCRARCREDEASVVEGMKEAHICVAAAHNWSLA